MNRFLVRSSAPLAVLAAAAIAIPAAAQTSNVDSPRSPAANRADQGLKRDAQPAVGSAERKFIAEAVMGGMAEVEGGQLAVRKATSQQVKAFGQRMVQDHGKANEQLKRLAAAKNVQLPTELDRKHRNDLARLVRLSESEFDREYMQHMVRDHRKDVADFRKAAKDLKDGEVKQFAAITLPTLEEHLRMAERTAAAIKD